LETRFKIKGEYRQQPTRVWQKWRFSAPQTHLWLNKHWFSASTFVVKIATFAKPQNVIGNKTLTRGDFFKTHFRVAFLLVVY
jgi:hypothetical protein